MTSIGFRGLQRGLEGERKEINPNFILARSYVKQIGSAALLDTLSAIRIFLNKKRGSGSVSPKFIGATLCSCPFGGQARRPVPTSMRR
jgi:hypothetical protein